MKLFKSFNVWITPTVLTALPSLLAILIAIAAIPILLKNLGMFEFGVLTISILCANQAQVFMFGVDRAATIEINKNNISRSDALTLLYCLSIAISTIAVIICYPSTALFFPKNINLVIWTLALSFIQLLWQSQKSILIADGRFGTLGALNFLHLSSHMGMPLALFYTDLEYNSAAQIIFYVFIFRASVFLISAVSHSLRSRFNFILLASNFKGLLEYGKWLGLRTIILTFNLNIDKILITAFLGPSSVTPYTISLQVAEKLAIFPQSVATVAFSKGTKTNLFKTRFLTPFFLVIYLPLTTLFFIFNDMLFGAWLGESAPENVAQISSILFVALIFASTNFVYDSVLETKFKAKYLGWFDGITALIFFCGLLFSVLKGSIVACATFLLLKEGLNLCIRHLIAEESKRLTLIFGLLVLIYLSALSVEIQVWK